MEARKRLQLKSEAKEHATSSGTEEQAAGGRKVQAGKAKYTIQAHKPGHIKAQEVEQQTEVKLLLKVHTMN